MTELIFTDTPCRAAADIIAKEYKGGKAALYGSSPDAARALAEAEISFVVCQDEPPEYARFFVGAGDRASLNAAKYFASGYPIILLPDLPERICFNRLCAKGLRILKTKEPEYAIFNKGSLRTSRAAQVASLFGALTDAIDLLSGRGCVSDLLRCARERLLDALLCPRSDIDSITALKEAEEAMEDLTGAAALMPLVNLALEGYTDTYLDFFSSYLINLSLLQFTKRNFNGILLGADRVRLRNALKPGQIREAAQSSPYYWRERAIKAVLSREQLKTVANRFLGEAFEVYRKHKTGKIIDNLLIAWEYTDTDGLFSALAGEGFIEGLTEDETKN